MWSDSAAVLRYNVLGGFRLWRDGSPVPPDAWERPMAARVVRLLLVDGGFVAEDRLLEAFWRDRDPAAARRCLAVSVCRCRGVLGAATIVACERAYRLVLGPHDTVDSDLFELAAGRALEAADAPARAAALEHAASRWYGEPLPEDRYADWAQEWRDALVDRYREVLAALSDSHARAGEHEAAVRAARRMLAADALDEGAHRRVMAGYAALGRRTRALEQFLRCRRDLIEAAGIEPSRETSALQARILAGSEAGLAA
jgi:DNA-binding SARP family transcriptional activator